MVNTKRKAYYHDIYKKMSHADRIHVIYSKLVHNLPIRQLVQDTGLCYNSIRNIIKAYKSSGRTNKKNFITILMQQTKAAQERGSNSTAACSSMTSLPSFAYLEPDSPGTDG